MEEKTVHVETVFTGRLLTVDVVDVELDSGVRSTREIVRHPGAVAVLCEKRDDGSFVLVRQYRKAAERVLLEVVAGTLEPGEEPDACARREVREETGFDVKELTKLGSFFAAPGYSEEELHAYYAVVDGAVDTTGSDSDEDLDVVILDSDQIEAMIADQELADAKTLAVWQLAQYR